MTGAHRTMPFGTKVKAPKKRNGPLMDAFTVDLQGEAGKKLRLWAMNLAYEQATPTMSFADIELNANYLVQYVKEGKL